jgi:hypothetical protein
MTVNNGVKMTRGKNCPLSLVSTIEELLERKSSGSGLESREYGRKNPSRWPRGTLYPQKLALTSPTSGGRSVGMVRSLTQATEFSFFIYPVPESVCSYSGKPRTKSIKITRLQDQARSKVTKYVPGTFVINRDIESLV